MTVTIGRRELLAALGGAAAAWPFAARAQQAGEHMRRIGVLIALAEDDPEAKAVVVTSGGSTRPPFGTLAKTPMACSISAIFATRVGTRSIPRERDRGSAARK